VNAIYFKGIWGQQFSKEVTRTKPFYLNSGATVQVPLMFQQERFRYMKGEGFQAVNLGYKGSDLSMLVLLPDRKDGLRELEERLTAQMLHDCVAGMTTREVELYLPRFKITWGTVNLTNQFSALGMPLAFDRSQADFSEINGYQPPDEEALFISAILHKAFVEVTEEGTEAAAATAVGFKDLAIVSFEPPPVPIFRADHPFLFAIRDRVSGAILFLGRMADPT
jgi:serpin B